ncbi:hypothetical protein FRC11_003105 [Ceratobasidium sp. 423]|nr:hypothetical protein FRC11_003105 [Ceratobasidium sp. 423]
MARIQACWSETEIKCTFDTIKAQLLVYAEERHQKKLKKCNQIQPTRMSAADHAVLTRQHGYAELLLLGQTIDQAPDDPLSLLVDDSSTITNTQIQPESAIFDSKPEQLVTEPLSSLEPMLSYAALTAQLSPDQLKTRFLTEIKVELAIWLGTGVLLMKVDPNNQNKKENVNVVDYWKINGEVLPLIHRMVMDVLPAQASSVSSKRVFSSSKLTCTREQNRISSELIEVLQVVKHSVWQHLLKSNECLLDFSERIAPAGDDIVE